MRVDATSVACAVCGLAWACSSAPPAEPSAPSPAKATPAASASKPAKKPVVAKKKPPPPPALPGKCADHDKYCLPPSDFVARLCNDKYPEVALVMFQPSEPWEHAFVKVKEVRPMNALGGPSSDARMVFSEEVILLHHRPYVARGPIQDDAPDNYDVLRFDGTCATLAEDEFWPHRPREPVHAPIIWKYLDADFREVLSQNARVGKAGEKQTDKCAGMYIGGGDAHCRRATEKLVTAISRVLATGVALPAPPRLPDWSPQRD